MQQTTEQHDVIAAAPRPAPKTGVAKALIKTVNPSRVLRLLSDIGLTDGEVATAVSADPRSVRRWRAGGDRGPRRYRDRIDDLRAVIVIFADDQSLGDQGIVHWLRARNRLLADERPLEALGRGHFKRVRDAALAFVADD